MSFEFAFADPFFAQQVTLHRTSGSYNDYGEWIETDSAPLTLTAIVQPVTEMREQESDGSTLSDTLRFYLPASSTVDVLRVNEGGQNGLQGSGGDVLEHDGQRYRAVGSKRWTSYVEITGVREQEQSTP